MLTGVANAGYVICYWRRRVMKYQKKLLNIITILLCISAQSAYSKTWHIYSDGSGDAPTVAAAIDSALAGDTILVAPGSYITGDDIGLNINKSVHLISEEGPENTSLHVLYTFEGSPVVTLFNLDSNSSLIGFTIHSGNPWWGPAGGIYVRNSSTLIQNNIIRDNKYSFGGAGGIYCEDGGSPIIRKNLIYNNEGSAGSAIYIKNCSATIDSNTIAYNSSYEDIMPAGTVVIDTDQPVIIANNIIVYNEGLSSGGDIAGIHCVSDNSNITIICNCVFGNTPINYGGFCADQTGINGNITMDPQFCASKPDSSRNFYIQSDSPCAPGNHPDGSPCALIGYCHIGCDTTSVEEETWSKIKLLYRK